MIIFKITLINNFTKKTNLIFFAFEISAPKWYTITFVKKFKKLSIFSTIFLKQYYLHFNI